MMKLDLMHTFNQISEYDIFHFVLSSGSKLTTIIITMWIWRIFRKRNASPENTQHADYFPRSSWQHKWTLWHEQIFILHIP